MLPPLVKEKLHAYLGLDPDVFHDHHVEYAWKKRMSEQNIDQDAVFAEILLDKPEELQALGDEIYTPQTWFFRHLHAFNYLREWVQDVWLTTYASTRQPLKVLSYPCASGEEVYSLVLILLQAGLQPDQFTVIGFDTRKYLLEYAAQAKYARASVVAQNQALVEPFCDCFDESGIALKADVRELPEFVNFNPLDTHEKFAAHAPYDIVFCRNLLVYLAPEYRRLLIQHLRNHMKLGGYLFAGNSDNVPAIDGRYKLAGSKGSYAYCFDENASAQPQEVAVAPPQGQDIEHLDHVQYTQEDTLKNARELAESGFHEEAEIICHEFLAKAGPNAETFFLLGKIYDAKGDPVQSEAAFRKCVYLENGHPEAYEALANLSEKRGHSRHAKELRERGTHAPFPPRSC